MLAIYDLQAWVLLALGVAALAMEVFAFIDALRHSSAAYGYAEKLTKRIWVIILGVAMAIGFVAIRNVLGIGLIAVVASGVYLADVRPALRQYRPRPGRSTSGPYGSW
jgi:uncharacterized protein DUF2516